MGVSYEDVPNLSFGKSWKSFIAFSLPRILNVVEHLPPTTELFMILSWWLDLKFLSINCCKTHTHDQANKEQKESQAQDSVSLTQVYQEILFKISPSLADSYPYWVNSKKEECT